MAHVFISYKREDNPEFLEELKRQLQAEKFDIWLDEKILSGEKWSEEIETNIRASFVVIVVVTSKAIESQWVNFEWAFALGTGAKVIAIILDKEVNIPEQLKAIQNIKFYEGYDWQKLIEDLRTHRNNTWTRYWISTDIPMIIKCALSGLIATDNASELDGFVKILANHRDEKSVSALIGALDYPDEIIQAKAAWALGSIQDQRAVTSLIKILDDNKAPVIVAHAIGALGNIGDSKAVPNLSRLLSNNSVFSSLARQPYRQDTISNQAFMALNLIGTPEALAAVEQWKQEQVGNGI